MSNTAPAASTATATAADSSDASRWLGYSSGTLLAQLTNTYAVADDQTPPRRDLNDGCYLNDELQAALQDDRRRNTSSHRICDKKAKALELSATAYFKGIGGAR